MVHPNCRDATFGWTFFGGFLKCIFKQKNSMQISNIIEINIGLYFFFLRTEFFFKEKYFSIVHKRHLKIYIHKVPTCFLHSFSDLAMTI